MTEEEQNQEEENPEEEKEEKGSNLALEIEPLLSKTLFSKFQQLCYYMRTSGLKLQEACELADIPHEEIEDLIEAHAPIKRAIRIQELVFKKALLLSIAKKAKTDPRYAQWLMERRYDDYSTSSKGKDNDPAGDDVLAQAFEQVLSPDSQESMVKDVPPPPPPPPTPSLTKDDVSDLKKTISDVLNDA